MSDIAKATPWGIACILLAIGNAYGLVDDKDAQTMLVILPAVAMTTMMGRGHCLKRSLGNRSGAQ